VSLDRILHEQREAAASLPAPGAVLGVSDWVAEEVLTMPEQPLLPFGKPRRPRPSPLAAHARTQAEQLAVARIVLRRPDVYGPGLCEWARRVLASEYRGFTR
jgi:hypothetical protein